MPEVPKIWEFDKLGVQSLIEDGSLFCREFKIWYLFDICIHLKLGDKGGKLVLLLLEIPVLILRFDQGVDAQK